MLCWQYIRIFRIDSDLPVDVGIRKKSISSKNIWNNKISNDLGISDFRQEPT